MKKTKKVLLVEDDSAIIDIYQTIIKKAGFEIEVISSGLEMMNRIKNIKTGEAKKPDIVLLDLVLPDINGLEILEEIRKNNETKDMVVFIMTNQEDAQLHFSDGVKPDKFIIKANITPSQLIELVKQKLG